MDDDNSPEAESFEVHDSDIAAALNPFAFRHRQTKKQAMLGVFAGDSDEDDAMPTRSGFGSSPKASTGPISSLNFVSGGLKAGASNLKPGVSSVAEEDDPLLKPSPAGGKRESRFDKSGLISERGYASFEKHTKGIGQKLLAKMGHVPGRGLGRDLQGIVTPVAAQKRDGKGAIGFYGSEKKSSKTVKKHSLLTTGEDGDEDEEEEEDEKSAQRTSKWRKNAGNKEKVEYVFRTTSQLLRDARTGKLDNTNLANQLAAENFRKNAKNERATVSGVARSKVIDLTGKEKREFSDYASAMTHRLDNPEVSGRPVVSTPTGVSDGKRSNFDVPELIHNLDVLIEQTEKEIISTARQLGSAKDTIHTAGHETSYLEGQLTSENEEMERLGQVMELFDKLNVISSFDFGNTNGGSTTTNSVNDTRRRIKDASERFHDCLDIFSMLYANFPVEFKLHGLVGAIVPVAESLLYKGIWIDWDPRTDPSRGVIEVSTLKEVVTDMKLELDRPESPYHYIFKTFWLPPVRRAALQWEVKSPGDGFYLCIQTWQSLLPASLWRNVSDQLIMPRLLAETEIWNPLCDVVPIHSWIHPWLPFLKERLQEVYPTIRRKIGSALGGWHPSDNSLRASLEPWLSLWSPPHITSFLQSYVCPKLGQMLASSPLDKSCSPASSKFLSEWLFSFWGDILPNSVMGHLLNKSFFPRWLAFLAAWLDSGDADFSEVSSWYSYWKGLVPAKVTEEPLVKDCLKRALHMMSRAAHGHPAMDDPAASLYASTSNTVEMNNESVLAGATSESISSLRDLLESRCEEAGLVFVPTTRSIDGKQLYQLGDSVQTYIDRNVIYIKNPEAPPSDPHHWQPVSIADAISAALR